MRTSTALLSIGLVLLLCGVAWVLQSRPIVENGSIAVVMCPECKETFLSAVRTGTVECALYDIGEEAGAVLRTAHADVITDDKTKAAYGTPIVGAGLMHDKFCVIDGNTVTSGSYNPTDGGELNKNNLLIIHSATLARNYDAEFQSIKDHTGRGRIPHALTLRDGNRSIAVENYFCPEDDCEGHVVAALAGAQTEVVFMTFSFTSNPIGATLQNDKHRGVHVEGICDGGQFNSEKASSECTSLGASFWNGTALLHHKVFVIDKSIVVTGSYNPTASGNTRNNENVLIIHDAAIAQQYLNEYAAVTS